MTVLVLVSDALPVSIVEDSAGDEFSMTVATGAGIWSTLDGLDEG